MTKLSKNFSRSEFKCSCSCGFDTVDAELLKVLQAVRTYFGTSVKITSGCRCAKHNKASGGAPKSRHRIGQAADIKVKGFRPRQVYAFLDSRYPDKYGIGKYRSWVHVDVREDKARW